MVESWNRLQGHAWALHFQTTVLLSDQFLVCASSARALQFAFLLFFLNMTLRWTHVGDVATRGQAAPDIGSLAQPLACGSRRAAGSPPTAPSHRGHCGWGKGRTSGHQAGARLVGRGHVAEGLGRFPGGTSRMPRATLWKSQVMGGSQEQKLGWGTQSWKGAPNSVPFRPSHAHPSPWERMAPVPGDCLG